MKFVFIQIQFKFEITLNLSICFKFVWSFIRIWCILQFNFKKAEEVVMKTCPSCVYTCHLLDLSFHLMHTPKFHLFHKLQKNREAIYGFGVLWCSFSLSNLFAYPRSRRITCKSFTFQMKWMCKVWKFLTYIDRDLVN